MPLRHSALAVLVALIWGANFVVIDAGLPGVPPLLFVAIRFVLVAFPAVLFVPRPRAPLRDVLLVGVFLSLGQFGFLYSSLHAGMPPGLASLVLQVQVPLTVLIAAGVLGERPRPVQVVGILIGAFGLAVVAFGRSATTPATALLLTLAAASSWAVGNILSRRISGTSGLSLTVWSGLVVPVPLFGLSLLLDGPATVGHALTHLPVSALWSTAYTVVLASLVGYTIWNGLLAKYAAANVVPFALLVPPAGIVTAWLAQGEVPNPAEATGGVLLLAGVAVTVLRFRPPRSGSGAGVGAGSGAAADDQAGPGAEVDAVAVGQLPPLTGHDRVGR